MILGIGTAVIHQERVWTVIAVRQHTRVLRSLDGRTVAYEAVDRLTEAP
ncbi:hypothetical protein [Curtobacterium sp. 'Ferrero']|nr:hypothetical protein [Curtobacterium sp. 'Ferrero']